MTTLLVTSSLVLFINSMSWSVALCKRHKPMLLLPLTSDILKEGVCKMHKFLVNLIVHFICSQGLSTKSKFNLRSSMGNTFLDQGHLTISALRHHSSSSVRQIYHHIHLCKTKSCKDSSFELISYPGHNV